eukprot:6496937-Pyramimonas_sp.AAC.2
MSATLLASGLVDDRVRALIAVTERELMGALVGLLERRGGVGVTSCADERTCITGVIPTALDRKLWLAQFRNPSTRVCRHKGGHTQRMT